MWTTDVHLDTDGIERRGNRWGFNSFTTLAGVKASLERNSRKRSEWYLWRLADGTFDWTASETPNIPGHPAEMVERYTVVTGRTKLFAGRMTPGE